MSNINLSQQGVLLTRSNGEEIIITQVTPDSFDAKRGGGKGTMISTAGKPMPSIDFSENFATISFSIPASTLESETVTFVNEMYNDYRAGNFGTLRKLGTSIEFDGVFPEKSLDIKDGSQTLDLMFFANPNTNA